MAELGQVDAIHGFDVVTHIQLVTSAKQGTLSQWTHPLQLYFHVPFMIITRGPWNSCPCLRGYGWSWEWEHSPEDARVHGLLSLMLTLPLEVCSGSVAVSDSSPPQLFASSIFRENHETKYKDYFFSCSAHKGRVIWGGGRGGSGERRRVTLSRSWTHQDFSFLHILFHFCHLSFGIC